MVDTKKEQERDELHRAIWAIADEQRGAVDGWDFKNYVLGTMFYRYISENLCNYINSGEIDATSDCVEVTNNNKLTPENIDRIVDVFAKREEVEYFSHLASYEEVSNNAYNLSVSTYCLLYTSCISSVKSFRGTYQIFNIRSRWKCRKTIFMFWNG